MRKRIRTLSVSYEPFFQTISEMGITQTNLIRKYNLSSSLFSRMKEGKNIQMDTILQLMKDLGVDDTAKIFRVIIEEYDDR